MSFSEFKEDFEKHYDDNIYAFINKEESWHDLEPCPFIYEEVENLDSIYHDSYGYEDTTLQRVYYFEDYGIHVMFEGNRSSYNGEEWYSYKEVSKKEKVINIWE